MRYLTIVAVLVACGGEEPGDNRAGETPDLVACETTCTVPEENAPDEDPRWAELETCLQATDLTNKAKAACDDLGLNRAGFRRSDDDTVEQSVCYSSCTADEAASCKDLVWLPYCMVFR